MSTRNDLASRLALAAVPALARLSADDLGALAHAFVVEEYEPGHTFIVEGDPANEVYILLAGKVEVIRVRGEQTSRLNEMQPGELFGLIALIDSNARSASCRGVGNTTVGVLRRQAYGLLINSHARIGLAFQRALAAQLARDFRNLDRQLRAEVEAPGA